jgi:hypothetical protein
VIARWFWFVVAIVAAVSGIHYAVLGDAWQAVDAELCAALGVSLFVRGRFPWESASLRRGRRSP